MMPRFVLLLVLMLVLAGCDNPQEISKEALMEKTRHWKTPGSVTWFYVGSKQGLDYFFYRDLGISETWCVKSGQIKLTRTFPVTQDEKKWVVMPWGPYAGGVIK